MSTYTDEQLCERGRQGPASSRLACLHVAPGLRPLLLRREACSIQSCPLLCSLCCSSVRAPSLSLSRPRVCVLSLSFAESDAPFDVRRRRPTRPPRHLWTFPAARAAASVQTICTYKVLPIRTTTACDNTAAPSPAGYAHSTGSRSFALAAVPAAVPAAPRPQP